MLLRQLNHKPWKLLKQHSRPLCVHFSSESSANSTANIDVDAGTGAVSMNPLKPFSKCWFKVPPWIQLTPINQNYDIMKLIGSNSSRVMKAYEISKLEMLFEKKVRSFLVSRCILARESINGPNIKKLHFMNKDIIGHFPVYVTSLSLMKCLIKYHEEFWIAILQSLALDRVIVLLDWKHELTPIEVLFFDHGLQLASQSETSCDLPTYKLESDASYYQVPDSEIANPEVAGGLEAAITTVEGSVSTKVEAAITTAEGSVSTKVGMATIASIIWNSRAMLDCQITSGLRCEDSEHAEAIGILSALQLARKLKIKKIDVVTDNMEIYEVLIGRKDVFQHKHRDVLLMAIEIAKEFDICRFRWEPRELLCLVNEMAKTRRDDYQTKTLSLRTIWAHRAYCLWGLPVIRINQTTKKIALQLEKGWAGEVNMRLVQSKGYHVNVQEQVLKLDALEGLVDSLDPQLLIVLVGSDESASKVSLELSWRYSSVLVRGSGPGQVDGSASNTNGDCSPIQKGTALVLHNETKIPQFSAQKVLLVVYDTPSSPIQFGPDQDTSGVITVSIIAPHEKASLADTSNEVDPFIFGFFNTAKTETLRKEKPPKKSFGEMWSTWEERRT